LKRRKSYEREDRFCCDPDGLRSRDPKFIGLGRDVREERNNSEDEYCRDYYEHEYLLGYALSPKFAAAI
jgi:hypothetical protein